MAKRITFSVIVHSPDERHKQLELSRRVSIIYADAVTAELKRLNCPAERKRRILEQIIEQQKNARS